MHLDALPVADGANSSKNCITLNNNCRICMKKWARKRLLDQSIYAKPPFSRTKREEVMAESGSVFAFDNVVEQWSRHCCVVEYTCCRGETQEVFDACFLSLVLFYFDRLGSLPWSLSLVFWLSTKGFVPGFITKKDTWGIKRWNVA